MSHIPSSLVGRSYRISFLDVGVAVLAPILAVLLRNFSFFYRSDVEGILVYSLLAMAATLFSLSYFGIGQILSRFLSVEDIKQFLKAAAAATLLTSALGFSFMRLDTIPRSLPALHFVVLAALLIGSRALMFEIYRRRENGAPRERAVVDEHVLLVGATRAAWLYVRMLASLPGSRQRIVAFLDDDLRLQGRSVCGHLIAGRLADVDAVLTEYANHGIPVHRIIVTQADAKSLMAARTALEGLCTERGIVLEFMGDRFSVNAQTGPEELAAQSLAEPQPASSLYLRMRSVLDVVLAAILLVALAPVFALVWVATMIDVGAPAIFWQERAGQNGRTISVHKFRTLRAPYDRSGCFVPEGERLSAIGRFLRKTRLDELPQLFDILRGDMALIGPRPLLPVDLPSEHSIRLHARPGLTGWAQVHGGKLVTAAEKNALDEWYITHASPLVDLHIVWLTLLVVFKDDRRQDRAVLKAIHFRKKRLAGGVRAVPRRDDSAVVIMSD